MPVFPNERRIEFPQLGAALLRPVKRDKKQLARELRLLSQVREKLDSVPARARPPKPRAVKAEAER